MDAREKSKWKKEALRAHHFPFLSFPSFLFPFLQHITTERETLLAEAMRVMSINFSLVDRVTLFEGELGEGQEEEGRGKEGREWRRYIEGSFLPSTISDIHVLCRRVEKDMTLMVPLLLCLRQRPSFLEKSRLFHLSPRRSQLPPPSTPSQLLLLLSRPDNSPSSAVPLPPVLR